mmetsp:Transcript_2864/g.6573  ORF Transcript_2864/g.6573 Transcript_2864/m.6573 type:complete len:247 (+) Transcript_2864:1805-2545(+)
MATLVPLVFTGTSSTLSSSSSMATFVPATGTSSTISSSSSIVSNLRRTSSSVGDGNSKPPLLISTTSSSLESSSAIAIFVKPVSCGASSSSSLSIATAVNAAGSRARSAFLPSTCVCAIGDGGAHAPSTLGVRGRVGGVRLLREPSRHRADAAMGTTSRRWRGLATPSRRRSYGSTSRAVQILYGSRSTQKDAAQRTSSNLSQACLSNLRNARLSGSSAQARSKSSMASAYLPLLCRVIPRRCLAL